MSYATSDALISEGLARMAAALATLAVIDDPGGRPATPRPAAPRHARHRRHRRRQDDAGDPPGRRARRARATPWASSTPTSASPISARPPRSASAPCARPLERLADAELVALEFLGVTSPATLPAPRPRARHRRGCVQARARDGFDRVLVDTSGLVEGDSRPRAQAAQDRARGAGRRWSRCSATDECEPHPARLRRTRRGALHRPPAGRRRPRGDPAAARRRTASGARRSTSPAPCRQLDPSRVTCLVLRRPDAAWPSIDVAGALVGLTARDGGTLGAGWVGARRCRERHG